MKRLGLAQKFFKGYFLLTLMLIAAVAVAKFSYNGSDWAVMNNEGGELSLGTQSAKAINFWTDQGNTVTGLSISGTTGDLTPKADGSHDIGTSALEFEDGFFDGTLKADILTVDVGPLTVTGGINVTTGSIDLAATGATLILEDGTGASTCIGTVTANGTTEVPVTTTCAQTGDYIFFSAQQPAVQSSVCWAHQIADGTDFDFDCDAANTTIYNWIIIKGQ